MAAVLPAREVSTHGLDRSHKRRQTILAVVTVAVSLGLARLILAWDLGALSALAIGIVIAVIFVQPRYGLYILFAVVLTFEATYSQEDPLQEPGRYLSSSPQSSMNIAGAILLPLEMFIVLVTIIWLAKGMMTRSLHFRPGAFGVPALLFATSLAAGALRGLMGGAVFNFSFWEIRFLLSMVIVYVLTANLIRTRGHAMTLSTIIVLGVGLSGIEGVWRKFALIDEGVLGALSEGWFAHDSVVTWGTLIMLVLAQLVFGGPRWQRIFGPILVVATGFTMLISERRAGYIAIIIAFIAFTIVLWTIRRKAFFVVALPLLLAGAVYLPLFWNNSGAIGQPARAVRSVIGDPDPRDAGSNAWRDLEAVNVRSAILSSPLLGLGFGQPIPQVVSLPSIGFFEFWNYWAHHAILWLWMKGGVFTFITFFALINGALARAMWFLRRSTDRELKSFAVAAISALLMAVVFSYVDLGLTGTRIPVIMGVMLGVISVIDRLGDERANALN